MALELSAEIGGENLSMRALAARANRSVSSLYNHVQGRDDLIEAMRARIVTTIDVSAFSRLDWDVATREWAHSYLAAFARHPFLIRLLATTPIRDRSTYDMYETVVVSLVAAGWHDRDAVAVMRSVEAFVLGAALDSIAPTDLLSTSSLDDGQPTMRRTLAPEYAESSSARAAAEIGLDALLAGLSDVLRQRR